MSDEQLRQSRLNQILVLKGDHNEATLYLPAYVSLKVKNIVRIEVGDSNADLNVVIIVRVYFGNLPQQLRETIWSKIQIDFSRGGSIVLQEEKAQKNEKKFNNQSKCWEFTLKRILSARVVGYTFFTPFQILDIILSLEFRKLSLSFSTPRAHHSLVVKINLINSISPDSSESRGVDKMIYIS